MTGTPTVEPPASAVLRIQGLNKQFGKSAILRDLNLCVAPGESLAIIGPNGAGKSTLFNLISGRTPPSSGEIWLRGQRIDGRPAYAIHRLGLSRSFQISHVFARLSVFENLRCAALWSLGHRYVFWRALSGLSDVRERADGMMARIGLDHRRDVLAADLSYAEQRALEIGLTVIGGADVVLLDEPTAGMSQSETRHFTGLIRALTRGKTLLTIEHDMNVVFDLADRVAVLVQGELLCCDVPQVVRADERVQQAYLGTLEPLTAAADVLPC
jgi:branched-chain amino acid transport system ATP-binding protein